MRMCVGSMKESRERCYRWKYELEVIGYEEKEKRSKEDTRSLLITKNMSRH